MTTKPFDSHRPLNRAMRRALRRGGVSNDNTLKRFVEATDGGAIDRKSVV